MIHNLKKLIPFFITGLFIVSVSCKNDKNEVEMSGLGSTFLNSLYPYPTYILNGDLNQEYNKSCGTATLESGTSTTSTSTTTTDSSSSIYKISAYYIIDLVQIPLQILNNSFDYPLATAVINTRFTYDERNRNFSLSPANNIFVNCNTSDYISCDAAGLFTCETVDNIKCGGPEAFIFLSQSNYEPVNPLGLAPYSIAFQAYVGTVDWTNGLTLSDDKSQVDFSDLKFTMIAKDQSIFEGRIKCRRPVF